MLFNSLLHHAARLVLLSAAGSAMAGTVAFSGNVANPGNAALVASDLGPALFTDDLAIANNVALHVLQVMVGGTVSFASTGFAGGGIDPYFTLFSGTSRASATFVESSFLHATTVGGDFTLSAVLAPGGYTVAIGVFDNLSFAENLGTGFLADGFTGLGGPSFLGDGSYVLTVTLPDTTQVPEPGGVWLTLTALAAAARASRRAVTLIPNQRG